MKNQFQNLTNSYYGVPNDRPVSAGEILTGQNFITCDFCGCFFPAKYAVQTKDFNFCSDDCKKQVVSEIEDLDKADKFDSFRDDELNQF